jgi:hypothetical protein
MKPDEREALAAFMAREVEGHSARSKTGEGGSAR